MLANRFAISITLLFLIFGSVYGQKNKKQLQRQKVETLAKLKEAERILANTQKQRTVTIGQLNALRQQIVARENFINSVKAEITQLDEEIDETNEIISSLEDDLQSLKQEYAEMVYSAYKANRGCNKLTFLFSASSFNQFFMRLKYMEQYGDARKKQVANINEVKLVLASEVADIKLTKSDKDTLLIQNIEENLRQLASRDEQARMVSSLSSKEGQLKSDIERRKSSLNELTKMIEDLVKEELKKAELAATDATVELSAKFAENKAKLPWPTKGFVATKFGRSRHPDLKFIELDNPGIDIQTEQEAEVKGVFGGTVTTVVSIPGFNKVVLVKHGDYFTTYSKLKEVYVKKNDKIELGQTIGKVYTDGNGVSEVHFEVWKGISKQDPEHWLAKK